jgi:hypothetical protein
LGNALAEHLRCRLSTRRRRVGPGNFTLSLSQIPDYIRATIAVMESLDLAPDDMEKICHRNARTIFALAN